MKVTWMGTQEEHWYTAFLVRSLLEAGRFLPLFFGLESGRVDQILIKYWSYEKNNWWNSSKHIGNTDWVTLSLLPINHQLWSSNRWSPVFRGVMGFGIEVGLLPHKAPFLVFCICGLARCSDTRVDAVGTPIGPLPSKRSPNLVTKSVIPGVPWSYGFWTSVSLTIYTWARCDFRICGLDSYPHAGYKPVYSSPDALLHPELANNKFGS